jgi:hypothetical protein
LRRADRDLELAARADQRSVRLQLEYLGAEVGLRDRGIRHAIVVFGSTRILDPESARRRVEAAEREATCTGAESGARAALGRAQRALERSRYYTLAQELGRIVGRGGEGPRDNRLVIVTGGGPGVMEAANRGAFEAGAASVGLNIALPCEQPPNPYLTPGLCFEFRYFALRKLHFMLRARALVALPGGYGTFDELFETLCLIQTGKRVPMPVVLVGEEFWRRAVDFDYLVDEEMISPHDLDLFCFAEGARDAWDAILRWYADRGRTVFDEQVEAAERDEI